MRQLKQSGVLLTPSRAMPCLPTEHGGQKKISMQEDTSSQHAHRVVVHSPLWVAFISRFTSNYTGGYERWMTRIIPSASLCFSKKYSSSINTPQRRAPLGSQTLMSLSPSNGDPDELHEHILYGRCCSVERNAQLLRGARLPRKPCVVYHIVEVSSINFHEMLFCPSPSGVRDCSQHSKFGCEFIRHVLHVRPKVEISVQDDSQ